jgi:hypothetical protein
VSAGGLVQLMFDCHSTWAMTSQQSSTQVLFRRNLYWPPLSHALSPSLKFSAAQLTARLPACPPARVPARMHGSLRACLLSYLSAV